MALKDKKLAEAIRGRLRENLLTCTAAFSVAEDEGVDPLVVGQTADAIQVHLSRCQLGLFGYPGHAKGWATARVGENSFPEELEEALRAARDRDGNLSCASAWELAEQFGISRIEVGFISDRLGVRIRQCQLGAF